MELRLVSKEIIKPASPTPQHLRTYKLSLIDQLVSDFCFSVILFYSKACKTTMETSNHLKQSLSNTLTYYYPLAGRLKDQYSVDCDDYGASFIEADIACEMSDVLRQPEIDLLEELLPFKPHECSKTDLNLNVQVNYFGCGGMAIGICFKHLILDASSAAHFVKNWAAVACDIGNNDVKDVIYDNCSIFPHQDLSGLLDGTQEEKNQSGKSITTRFTFDGTKIASLREEIGNDKGVDRPTRFEVVCAIIFGAVQTAVKESDATTPTYLEVRIVVNLRQKMNPPFPQHSMGNVVTAAPTLNWPMEKKVDYNSFVGELRQKIRMVDDQYARKLFGADGEVINLIKNGTEILSNSRWFGFTSWCRFPCYEADFGWGKPMWVCTGNRLSNCATLIDSSDGKGVEAWVGLPKEDMVLFEKDPAILKYASFNPSIC